jgi:hypothetical protein
VPFGKLNGASADAFRPLAMLSLVGEFGDGPIGTGVGSVAGPVGEAGFASPDEHTRSASGPGTAAGPTVPRMAHKAHSDFRTAGRDRAIRRYRTSAPTAAPDEPSER